MSSAGRSGSCSGPIAADTVTVIRRVAPNTAPAKTNGDGGQLFSAPWCSSVCTVSIPCSSAYAAISGAARCLAERAAGPAPGATRLKRTTVTGMEKSPSGAVEGDGS